ncbi:hypothetical protein KDF28_004786 [Escherichia coli]|nr:hypothetical protein [Escherichia coli]EIC8564218.1 hypothetical protein [Escherichia coli]EMB1662707.1 hypothetical protein [Escherichia coli]
MKNIKTTLGVLATALMLSAGAHAVQKNITVTADIDPTIDLLQADGSALPTSIALTYNPVGGLQDYTINTKIYTNDTDKDVIMQLVTTPMLTHTTDSTEQIELAVTYNGIPVTDTPWTAGDLDKSVAFNTQDTGASISMPLVIGPAVAADTVDAKAGTYQGVVSMLVTQSTQTVAPTP